MIARPTPTVLLATAAVAVALAIPSPASAEPVACGSILVRDTVLTSDLVGCVGSGLVIAADGVTLDLAGHSVQGTGTGYGIEILTDLRATVRNGTISGFSAGIVGSSEPPGKGGALIENVTAERNGVGFSFLDAGRVEIANSQALHNTRDGIWLANVDPVRVEGNLVVGNGGIGISTDNSEPALISNNRVVRSGGIGIYTSIATTALVANRVSHSGSHGIYVSDDYMIFFPYWFQDNVSEWNGGYGIAYVSDALVGPNGETVDGGGNSAKHNRGPAQCLNIVCSHSPGQS